MNTPTRPPARAVVLAAGLGTRMRSATPKVLHPICGRPMLAYVLDAARQVSSERPILVVSPATQLVGETFADETDLAVQAEPRGTADAVRAALAVLPADVAEIVVLSGDVPLVDPELLVELREARHAADAALALVSVEVGEPGGLGRVVRGDDGRVSHIVEAQDASPDELDIDEINAGLYAFEVAWLRRRIGDVKPSAASGELYLPELVAMARVDDRAVATLEVEDDGTLLGINDRSQLADAEVEMRLRINEAHMRAGVTLQDPASAFIEAGVRIAPDVTIEPGVVLRGATEIASGAIIRTGTQVVDCRIGERSVVWASILEESVVEADVTIGPFSHVRKGAHISSGVELGNYAEVKNSVIGPGTKSHHFSYLGDADVGERVNIGAGTITANYDGQRKHRTTIEDRAFIGSDTILRAPVTIGHDAVTGAGSVVTRDVPEGMLALGVPARLRHRRPRPGEADGAADGPQGGADAHDDAGGSGSHAEAAEPASG